jgi:hypothetical protein
MHSVATLSSISRHLLLRREVCKIIVFEILKCQSCKQLMRYFTRLRRRGDRALTLNLETAGSAQSPRIRKLAAVAQPRGYAIDGQMYCPHHELVGIAAPMTLQELDLYVVERIKIRKAVLD